MNKINWKMIMHISGRKFHSRLYRSKFMDKWLQAEVHTPVLNNLGALKDYGESELCFYIDGDGREFRTENELIRECKRMSVHS